jgi:hypothetical protein
LFITVVIRTKWLKVTFSFESLDYNYFRNTSKNRKILPKTEKYFQKQKSTSKNTAILPNIEMYYQK